MHYRLFSGINTTPQDSTEFDAAPEGSTGWRPIESAPRDGTKFLSYKRQPAGSTLFGGHDYEAYDQFKIVWWETMDREKLEPVEGGLFKKTRAVWYEAFISGWDRIAIPQKEEPTHWQPLPEPPA